MEVKERVRMRISEMIFSVKSQEIRHEIISCMVDDKKVNFQFEDGILKIWIEKKLVWNKKVGL